MGIRCHFTSSQIVKRSIVIILLFFAAGIVRGACPQKHLSVEPVTVYEKGEGGYDTFRIPALIRTAHGSLLAFAEARKNGAGDTGDIDLVVKRSHDGGKTWGDFSIIWDDADNVCGNPSPVVDSRTGKIILVMTWNDGRDLEKAIHSRESFDTRKVFVTCSEDDGYSWSEPLDITSSVKDPEWTWYATGPCHAVQLTRGKHRGRIVVPCNHGVYDSGPQGTVSHIIYSDDSGVSWNIGAVLPVGNESTICELGDGRLMLNMRGVKSVQRQKEPFRWAAISSDGGKSFHDPYLDKGLTEPVCNASIINLSFNSKAGKKILFSNPSDARRRVKMTVHISTDNGGHWMKLYTLPGKRAAYSDMCVLDCHSVAVLYENGEESPYERISICICRI